MKDQGVIFYCAGGSGLPEEGGIPIFRHLGCEQKRAIAGYRTRMGSMY